MPVRPGTPAASELALAELAALSGLDALTTALFSDFDIESRLKVICDFWVPKRATWIIITLVDPNSRTSRVAAVDHRDGAKAQAMRARLQGAAYSPADRSPWGDPAAEIAFALQYRGTPIGVLHLGVENPTRTPDTPFYEAVADRCALALYNAQLFEEQRRISLTFQNAAMATEMPQVPGFRFDAVYEAAQADALVGGDWYDAFRIEDGRIIISIGDVAGSGLHAAVAMMSVRQAIRGVAQVHPDPSVMLAAAERTLTLQHENRMVTAFVAVIDPVTQQCSYANAGHPRPFLRYADGTTHQLHGAVRHPLGLADFGQKFSVYHAPLPPGSLLVLYTDGLIESTKNVLEGEHRLHEALKNEGVVMYDNVARQIHAMVLGARSRDDVAILTVRVESIASVQRWRFDPMWSDAAQRVRTEIVQELRLANFAPERLTDFEVIFSELMSNVLRHAPGTVEVLLERHATQFVFHVLDKGDGFLFIPKLPSDLFSEYGRGLFLIAHLSTDFSVERRPGGGSHARVVLASNGVPR